MVTFKSNPKDLRSSAFIDQQKRVSKKLSHNTILGIDPGTNILGYSIIEIVGKEVKLISLGVVQLDKEGDHYAKLKKIFEKVNYLIEEYQPNQMAVETPFYGKNAQSMLKLGRAQGVAITAAAVNLIPVFEYAPLKIKQSITGRGRATKEQVADMLQRLLKLDRMPKYFDASDALGVAVCHHYQQSSPGVGLSKSSKGWKAFLSENPDRVK